MPLRISGRSVKDKNTVEPTERPGGAVTHGQQLTVEKVGLSALGSPALLLMPRPERGWFRLDTELEWLTSGAYEYNDDESNNGGIVPSGGLDIDGVFYPEGTFVVQFKEFEAEFYASWVNAPGILFRGCTFLFTCPPPGYMNSSTLDDSKSLSFHYCEWGGTGDVDNGGGVMKLSSGAGGTVLRNKAGYSDTPLQVNANQYDILENWIDHLILSNPEAHINGITVNGSESCMRVERNHIVAETPDFLGNPINQTDCISFFQDFGTFPGTGINSDGTLGYRVLDNYVGGTGYCIYAGQNAGTSAGTVQNMVMTGNLVTTSVYPNGGAEGPLAAAPPWGEYGNVWENNRWADGPNAGQLI